MSLFRLICFLVLVFAGPSANAGAMLAGKAAVHRLDHGNETLLVSALEKIRQGDTRAALPLLQQLVSVNPKFKLAQLMYADL